MKYKPKKIKIVSLIGKKYFCKKKITITDVEKTFDSYIKKLISNEIQAKKN